MPKNVQESYIERSWPIGLLFKKKNYFRLSLKYLKYCKKTKKLHLFKQFVENLSCIWFFFYFLKEYCYFVFICGSILFSRVASVAVT